MLPIIPYNARMQGIKILKQPVPKVVKALYSMEAS